MGTHFLTFGQPKNRFACCRPNENKLLLTVNEAVNMAKISAKKTRKYLLNDTNYGFSQALKLSVCTARMVNQRILLRFIKKDHILSLHGGLLLSSKLNLYVSKQYTHSK